MDIRKGLKGPKPPYEIFTDRVEYDQIHISDSNKEELEELIAYLLNPEPHGEGARSNGVILKGLPGTGKTYFTKHLRTILTDILSKEIKMFVAGSFEEPNQVNQLYEDARKTAKKEGLALVFIDEVDRYGKRKEIQDPTKHAILNQLLIELDSTKSNKGVFTINATNMEGDIDPAYRRGKRCGKEILFEPLNKKGRRHVMEIEAFHKDHEFVYEQANLDGLVDRTFGYTGADVSQLFEDVSKRANLCLQRSMEEIADKVNYQYTKRDVNKLTEELGALPLVNLSVDLKNYGARLIETGKEIRKLKEEGFQRRTRNLKLVIQMLKHLNPNNESNKETDVESDKEKIRWIKVSKEHFDYALEKRVPSALKDMPWEETSIKFSDFAGYEHIETLIKKLVGPMARYYASGKDSSILDGRGTVMYFYGKDGCGVTSYARAIAGEYGFNLMVISGADPESKWVGETKDRINTIIDRAKASAPTVVVFDNLKYLITSENSLYRYKDSQTGALRARLKPTKGVIYIATGETLDEIEPSIRSKFKYTFQFEKPEDGDVQTREKIWNLYIDHEKAKKGDINIERLAEQSSGLTGGDIKDICARMSDMNFPYERNTFMNLINFYREENVRAMDDATRFKKLRIKMDIEIPDDDIPGPNG